MKQVAFIPPKDYNNEDSEYIVFMLGLIDCSTQKRKCVDIFV